MGARAQADAELLGPRRHRSQPLERPDRAPAAVVGVLDRDQPLDVVLVGVGGALTLHVRRVEHDAELEAGAFGAHRLHGEAVGELAAIFNDSQSDYEIVPVYTGNYTEGTQKLTAAIAGGTATAQEAAGVVKNTALSSFSLQAEPETETITERTEITTIEDEEPPVVTTSSTTTIRPSRSRSARRR